MNTIPHVPTVSEKDLMTLGLNHIAYVKQVVIEGETVFMVRAADGAELAIMATRDHADVTVRQHGMEPLSVH